LAPLKSVLGMHSSRDTGRLDPTHVGIAPKGHESFRRRVSRVQEIIGRPTAMMSRYKHRAFGRSPKPGIFWCAPSDKGPWGLGKKKSRIVSWGAWVKKEGVRGLGLQNPQKGKK